MSLKFKFSLYVIVLHASLLALIYYQLRDQLWYFLLAEALVLVSLFLSYLLYKSFIRPTELINSGSDAIADKDFSIKYLKTGSIEVDKLVNIYNNMIDTLRGERIKLSEQSYFIQKLIEVTPIGIIIMDYDGLISNINPAAKRHLGIGIQESMIGENIMNHPSEIINVFGDSEESEIIASDAKVISSNGIDKYKVQVNEVIHQGFKRKFILIDDLSQELIKSEKEAFGRIIRMMAHEVNNSMGAINSILDSVVEFGFEGQGDQELKESLIIAKQRNEGLSAFMANYASLLRLPPPLKKSIDLCHLLRKTGQLFVFNAEENNIVITFDIPDSTIFLHADTVLLEQAIANMIKNSIESIETSGEIKISCSDGPIKFTISDNGSGISEEAASNLFKPFYSTKTTGQGVGLMLIRDVLQSHQANFRLFTDEKSGWTHFEVIF